MRVRLRIDGVMTEAAPVPRRIAAGVVSRVKIMSDLDIAERRLPQDGRVGLRIDGRHVDLRVVTIPSVQGESVVLRILDQSAIRLELDHLGFQPQELDRFRRAFSRSHGAILATGPTGSGKSTTLYGALLELNTDEKNIITIEDPVEYQLPGITQMQVNVKAGLTFDSGLRSMMRADPDILMVGEIRDRETAQIAVEGALTGHLVLSTLHTNDAPSAISRLIEMGIEPFLVASAIDCVVGQRLARTLCQHCKERTVVPVHILREHGFQVQFDIEAYRPVGCVRCAGMGYRGRTGIYEVMTMSEELRELTLTRASADQITAVAVRQGMRKMREDGLEKVKAGITSLAEVTRIVGAG
jgi:type IV pilus assembly protein PilB